MAARKLSRTPTLQQATLNTIMRYLIAALTLLPTLALDDITGPAKVIAGDTIEISRQRLRLHW